MKRQHRHHHAITAGRSAREYQQNAQAQAAVKIWAAAELLTDAAALLRDPALAMRAFGLAERANSISGQPTPGPSKEGKPSICPPAAHLATDLAEADTAEPVAVKFPARPASGARANPPTPNPSKEGNP